MLEKTKKKSTQMSKSVELLKQKSRVILNSELYILKVFVIKQLFHLSSGALIGSQSFTGVVIKLHLWKSPENFRSGNPLRFFQVSNCLLS